ncbi:hydrogenase [Candidatus Saccharibacteria bacterium]|nr:hydrogenase [Candidatus Saccharibacteria bacterium]
MKSPHRNQTSEVLKQINDPGKTVIVITSPAVRVGIGDTFGFAPGEFLEGKMIAALKGLGFSQVFDTTFGADLTSMEEATELRNRVKDGGKLPMFTSCCPAWVMYANHRHPELKDNISTCKSPIGMISSYLKHIYTKEHNLNPNDLIIAALTPCTIKKMEIVDTDCDFVITTSELADLIKDKSIDFRGLVDMPYDALAGSSSGTIFGTSGGVMLSALRVYYHLETGNDLPDDLVSITKEDHYTTYSITIDSQVIKCAVVSGLPNLEKLLPAKDEFIFVEVMNCLGGCVNGPGQPTHSDQDSARVIAHRQASLTSSDRDNSAPIRYPYQNPAITAAYSHDISPLLHKH